MVQQKNCDTKGSVLQFISGIHGKGFDEVLNVR
jgi:hypothetical protein